MFLPYTKFMFVSLSELFFTDQPNYYTAKSSIIENL